MGRQIWSQAHGGWAAGWREIVWGGKNTAGQLVAAGTYFYHVEHRAGSSETKALNVVR
jgi:hypothetical protein